VKRSASILLKESAQLVAQSIVNGLLATSRPEDGNNVGYNLLTRARAALLKFSDPLIAYPVGGAAVKLPFSHDLPVILARYPQYGQNLGHVASHVAHKYPDGSVIDIGANVGDTAALIRQFVDLPILCIEGDPTFFEILRRNAPKLEDVELAQTFLGDRDQQTNYQPHAVSGTLALSPSENEGVSTARLTTVLQAHPRFQSSCRLIKTDTDGFDIPILASASSYLQSQQPVVFLEFSPFHFVKLGHSAEMLEDVLRRAGYRTLLVWDNRGAFHSRVDVQSPGVLVQLAGLCTRDSTDTYFDVAAFSQTDEDVATATYADEQSRSAIPRPAASRAGLRAD